MAQTEYVVLQETDLGDGLRGWYPLAGTIAANKREDAIRRVAHDLEKGGIFCAVPVSSWQPLEAKVTRTITLSEPTAMSAPEPENDDVDDPTDADLSDEAYEAKYGEPRGAGADPAGRPDPQTSPDFWTE